MTKQPAPPENITEKLRAMDRNQSLVFKDCPAHSVRAIASRMMGKKFATRKEGDSLRVWRLK